MKKGIWFSGILVILALLACLVFASCDDGGPGATKWIDDLTVTTSFDAPADSIKDADIDWGTSANQVSGSDMPDEDLGTITVATGVWTVEDDSHAHTTTTISGIDISADTNLTGGAGLTLTDDDMAFDGGESPGGELGGTWASPTIDDSVSVATWTITGGLTLSNADTSAGSLLIYEDSDDGTNKTTITVGAQAGDLTVTLPATAGSSGQFLQTNGSGVTTWATPTGTGDVVGPASAVDNTVARYDSTTGKLLQGSNVAIGDAAYAIIDTQTLAIDGTYDLPNATSGIGYLMVGDDAEWAIFSWSTAAVVNLMIYSANVTTTGASANKFNIFDNGTAVRLENKLGAEKTVKMQLNY